MKILFGSIIVKGAGRLNGHQVRNFRGQALLTRLSLPTQSSTNKNSVQKNYATESFKKWSTLSTPEQELWTENATQVSFIDRWGNTKFMRGRDFVSYLNLNLLKVNMTLTSAATFVATKPTLFLDGFIFDLGLETVTLLNYAQVTGSRVAVFAKWTRNKNRNFSEKELKYYQRFNAPSIAPSTLFVELTRAGITPAVGDYLTLGFKNVSTSGLVSPMIIIKSIVVSNSFNLSKKPKPIKK